MVTNADQFSVRLDHQISDRSQFFARFNFNNLYGPTTNPDQTTIDPAFGIRYVDHQRNLVLPLPAPFPRAWFWNIGQRHPLHALFPHHRPYRPCRQVQRRLLRAFNQPPER